MLFFCWRGFFYIISICIYQEAPGGYDLSSALKLPESGSKRMNRIFWELPEQNRQKPRTSSLLHGLLGEKKGLALWADDIAWLNPVWHLRKDARLAASET